MTQSGILIAPLAVEAFALRRGDHSFRVLRCGMGATRARDAADRIRSDPAPAIVVGGLCGAIDPAHKPGDLIIPDELRSADLPPRQLDADSLRHLLSAKGWRVHGGTMLSVDRIVKGSQRLALLDSGASAIDMESAWLANAASDRPFVVLRVVVDGPGNELIRPGTIIRGYRALVRLHQASAVLDEWAEKALQESNSNFPHSV